jgi:hypothetical protein
MRHGVMLRVRIWHTRGERLLEGWQLVHIVRLAGYVFRSWGRGCRISIQMTHSWGEWVSGRVGGVHARAPGLAWCGRGTSV